MLLAVSASAAEAFSNKSSAQCGGLFLLHTSDKHLAVKSCGISDTLGLRHLEFFGGFHHYSINGRYSDGWSLKGNTDGNIGNAGFRGHFKSLTIEVDVNSLPLVRSGLTLHSVDSSVFVGARFARGNPEIGSIRWISKNKHDIVHEIAVHWQTHLFYRGLSTGVKLGNHRLEFSGENATSNPENPDQEYYIRDSIDVMALQGTYSTLLGGGILKANYRFVNADISLFGIYHQEESRKRFLYVPLDAQLNIAQLLWTRKSIAAHLDFASLHARMEADPRRFYETLAPNRALPSSVLKALSFSFLQKDFRVNTDFDAMGFLAGINYTWSLGHKFYFHPIVNPDIYYANGEADIHRKTETTILISTRSAYEHFVRKIESLGTLLAFGFNIGLSDRFQLSASATQMVPFFINYKEIRPDEIANDGSEKTDEGTSNRDHRPGTQKDKRTEGDVPNKTSAAFRNGFAANLSLIFKF